MRYIERNGQEFIVNWKALFKLALDARTGAHAPYSRFPVGAAIEDSRGYTYDGHNVENMSYGLTNCAERVAIQNLNVTTDRPIKRVCVVLVGGHKNGGSPCGACRQVIWEFAGNNLDVEILTCDPDETTQCRLFTIGELLPDPFVFHKQ